MIRIVIADDEPRIRKALKIILSSLNTELEVVGEADNGEDVLKLAEELRPDVLFLDIVMPKLDGLDTLEKLREKGMNIKVIIISGYNDFAYAKKAISHDAIDYLPKPFDENDVRKALYKAVDKMKTEETYMNAQILLNQMSMEDIYIKKIKLLQKVYNGHRLTKDEIESLSHTGGWKVILLIIKDYENTLEQQFDKDSEILSFCISRFTEEILEMDNKNALSAISPRYGHICWLAIPDNQEYTGTLKHLGDSFKEYLKLDCLLYYSQKLYKIDQLSTQINGLEEYSFYLNLPDFKASAGILSIKDIQIKPLTDKVLEHINKSVKEVNHIIRHSLYFHVKPFIDGIYDFAAEQGILSIQFLFTLYSSFRNEIEELLNGRCEIGRGIVERNGFGLHISFDHENAVKLFLELITYGIEQYKILNQTEAMGGRVKAIKEYIDSFYSENLSLENLAEQFFISKQYLANKFKTVTGVTVLDYIHNKRLSKAKELLADSSLPVSEIATHIGYDSISYFNKLFRREFGVTPTEFRDLNKTRS